MSIDLHVRVHVKWRTGGQEHVSPWPPDVRVPVAGELVVVPHETEAREVTSVIWHLDGSALVVLD